MPCLGHLLACRALSIVLVVVVVAGSVPSGSVSMGAAGARPVSSPVHNATRPPASTPKPPIGRGGMTRPRASVSIVLLDGNTTHDRNPTELSGEFTQVGTVADASGYLRQIHPCDRGDSGKNLFPKDWIAVFMLEEPDHCGSAYKKANLALSIGALAVIFDVTDNEKASHDLQEEKTRDRLVQLLLSKNANVNLKDEKQRTALSYACEMRCNDVVRSLVRNNVDPDIPDIQGNTALIYSASVGNDVAIEILIRSFRRLGLNVDQVNEEGMSALLVAAKGGFIECATILATDGRASVFLRDPQNGMTAEDWARMRGCSSPEVLPLSVNSNQRLVRCGSSYVARRATEAHAVYSSALQSITATKLDVSAEEATGGTDDSDHHLPTIGAEATDGGPGRLVDLPAPPRRKRNSLPSIKLWSSLDLPSQRSTAVPIREDGGPSHLPLGPPLHSVLPSSSLPLRQPPVSEASESSARVLPQRQRTSVNSSSKRHRDVVRRADTEVSTVEEIL